jgi:hypothetical protein
MPAALILLGAAVDDFFLGDRARSKRLAQIGCAATLLAAIGATAGGVIAARWYLPELERAAWNGGAALIVAAIITCSCYDTGRRGWCLVSLGLSAVVLFLGFSPVVYAPFDARPEAAALRALVDEQVPLRDSLRWVGRQDSRLVFYARLPVPRLDDPLDFLTHPEGFESIEEWSAHRLNERLLRTEPIWLLIESRALGSFKLFYDPPMRELGRVTPGPDSTLKELILITNLRF